MLSKRIALVTGANQGVGFQVAKELVRNGLTVLVGSRNFERGEAAAKKIGEGAIALHLDVTDQPSLAAAAERIARSLAVSTCLSITRRSRIRKRATYLSRSTQR